MHRTVAARSANVHEISVHRFREGQRWVFLAQVDSDSQREHIDLAIADLGCVAQVRMLCSGQLLGCVVQAGAAQTDLLYQFEELLTHECSFIVAHRSFDEVIWQVVRDLTKDSGSKLHDMPSCDVCGCPEPFPTVTLTFTDFEGRAVAGRNYCVACAAQPSVSNHKGFVRTLLKSGRHPIDNSDRWNLVRCPTHKQMIRFRVECGSSAS